MKLSDLKKKIKKYSYKRGEGLEDRTMLQLRVIKLRWRFNNWSMDKRRYINWKIRVIQRFIYILKQRYDTKQHRKSSHK